MRRLGPLILLGTAFTFSLVLVAVAGSQSKPDGKPPGATPAEPAASRNDPKPAGGFFDSLRTPRRPGNVLARGGIAGYSAEGRPIGVFQRGVPTIEANVLVFGCIHGDECAASGIQPLANRGPDPDSDVYVVPNLNPDGAASGSRLNGRGVDLNRNFAAGWRPIGERGDPQYSGPRPFSEPETRLAAEIIRRLQPTVTIWFHQYHGSQRLVRAWGQSIPAARRFAELAGVRFRRIPWPTGTAPNWQNHSFPGTASFVVELPRGPLTDTAKWHLGRSIVRLARQAAADGDLPGKR